MKYIAFLSFGKDSIAQLIKIKELGLPLDEVVYVDIRYTPEISGEHPIMAEWIPTAEEIARLELCQTKCLCPEYRAAGMCCDCDVFLALRGYHALQIAEACAAEKKTDPPSGGA